MPSIIRSTAFVLLSLAAHVRVIELPTIASETEFSPNRHQFTNWNNVAYCSMDQQEQFASNYFIPHSVKRI